MTGMTSEQIREIIKVVLSFNEQRDNILVEHDEPNEIYNFGFDAGIELALKLMEILGSALTSANIKDIKEVFVPYEIPITPTSPTNPFNPEPKPTIAVDWPSVSSLADDASKPKVEYVNAPQKVEFDVNKSNGFVEKPEVSDKMQEAFKSFLEDYGAYNAYLTNIIKRGHAFEEITTEWEPSEYICSAFSWKDTKEGQEYWSTINKTWITELNGKG